MNRPRTLLRGAVASLLTAIVLLAVALPLAAPIAGAERAGQAMGRPHVAAAPLADPHVNVTITTNGTPTFAPSVIHVTAGENLTITLNNSGSYNHTFTMSTNGTEVFPLNWSPTQLEAYFVAHPPLVNASMPADTISHVNVSVNASMAGGNFEFVSVLPYQFQAGLYGFMDVTPPVSSSLTFYVNASDTYRFLPDSLNASSVTKFPVAINVFFGTVGVLSHTFTLSPVPDYNLSSSNYSTFFTQHAPLVNIPVPTSAGSYNNATFVITTAGYYEYICSITGHFANGMFGFLYVGIPTVVPYVANVSTAIVQSEILVGGGSLLAIGVVLAAAAAVTGRVPPPKPGEEKFGHY